MAHVSDGDGETHRRGIESPRPTRTLLVEVEDAFVALGVAGVISVRRAAAAAWTAILGIYEAVAMWAVAAW